MLRRWDDLNASFVWFCFWPNKQYGNSFLKFYLVPYISIQSAKTRLGADCGSDHELLTAKFRLKLKKVGKTTRPFRYDLNQIPYDYTVELTNRFQSLDLIDRVTEAPWMRFVTLYRRQWSRPSPRVQFNCSVMSDSLQLHGLQCARPLCPSPTPGVYSNSCPLSWWCHWTISSSSLLLPPSIFPASGSFQISRYFESGGQSIGASASASVLPMNIRTDFLEDGLVWSPCSPTDPQESSPTPQFKNINFLALSFL